MKALVVESQRVYRGILKEILDAHGIDALFAETGQQAIETFKNQDLDLICSAMHLADTSGMELCAHLKAQFGGVQCPFILLTADREPGLMDEAMGVGVTEVVQKSDLDSLNRFLTDLRGLKDSRISGRVLVVEDSPSLNQMVVSLLENMGLEGVSISAAQPALERLQGEVFDLVITDLSMADKSGIWLLRAIRGEPSPLNNVPVLVMTAFNDNARRIEVFRAGANDYLTKPIIEEELVARVTNLVSAKQLLDKVENQREQLHKMAMTDQLTGLHGRHFLAETAPRTIAEAYRHGTPLSMVVVDIDHFKQINDEHGHNFGDRVLQNVAGALQDQCREEDLVARFGGEEFVILLPHCERASAGEKAERLRGAIEAQDNDGVAVSASFGVAALSLDITEDFERLFSRADKALYSAKEAGRSRVVLG